MGGVKQEDSTIKRDPEMRNKWDLSAIKKEEDVDMVDIRNYQDMSMNYERDIGMMPDM
jgi:hypothetical protein